MYRARWYDNSTDDGTGEPIGNLTRTKVLDLKKLQPPGDIDKAVVDWKASVNQNHIYKRDFRRVEINYGLEKTDSWFGTSLKSFQKQHIVQVAGFHCLLISVQYHRHKSRSIPQSSVADHPIITINSIQRGG